MLFVLARRSQELPISPADQGQAVLDQTSGLAAHFARFPSARRNARCAEQHFCNRSMTMTLLPTIERAQDQHQAPAALLRQAVRGGSKRLRTQGTPETVGSLVAHLEVAVIRQQCRVGHRAQRLPAKPHAVLACADSSDDMPAVCRSAQLIRRERRQLYERRDDRHMLADLDKRQNSRQLLRRPEHRLGVERQRGISGEISTPNASGS
ncbi:hypothetical protein ACVILH_002176 [Bradyrhizobium sp. USDA 4353]